MCFLCGKGDRTIQFVEVTNKDPYFVEGLKFSGEQTRGACLVPKRAMDVMSGEVNRILQLCSDSIVPITWQVPRKSYREYHADIYPETCGLDAAMGPGQWMGGDLNDAQPAKINLDPKKRPKDPLTVFQVLVFTLPGSLIVLNTIEWPFQGEKLKDRPKVLENTPSSTNGANNHAKETPEVSLQNLMTLY